MNDVNKAEITLLEDAAIKTAVNEVWGQVMETGNKVISHWKQYGFEQMCVVPDPNIHALLVPVRKLEELMDKILASEHLQYEESRMVLNAKQQLIWMELLAAALATGRRGEFDDAMQKIRNQPQI